MNPVQAASEVIKNAIEASQGPLPPAFLVQFLLNHWRRYLALTHRDHGESNEEWVRAVRATEQLLWSVAPKATEEDRAALTKSLDSLVASLKQAMIVAGCHPQAQSDFLRQLSEWHVKLIIGRKVATQASQPDDGSAPGKSNTKKFDLDETVRLDVRDPRYRELMDMLNNASLEKIDI